MAQGLEDGVRAVSQASSSSRLSTPSRRSAPIAQVG